MPLPRLFDGWKGDFRVRFVSTEVVQGRMCRSLSLVERLIAGYSQTLPRALVCQPPFPGRMRVARQQDRAPSACAATIQSCLRAKWAGMCSTIRRVDSTTRALTLISTLIMLPTWACPILRRSRHRIS